MIRRAALVGLTVAACVGTALVAPTGAGAQTVTHRPRVAQAGRTTSTGWSSSNWSGYAVTGSGFNSVGGTWTVPAVARSRKATYSSNWIGIDGFNNSNLIQTGTESDYYNGAAHYGAWWEILPAAETVITTITVRPGDVMTAAITHGSGSSWTITIKDVTTGRSFTTVQSYSGQQTSAEWIEEAPSVGGRIAPLANYGTATFDPGTVNGGSPHLVASDGGAMVQKGVQVSTPSNPDGDADGFRTAYGSTAPAPPSS
jgi:hypothetical protein